MDDLRRLHEAYREHKKDCIRSGDVPLEYTEWLEEFALGLAEELANYMHASETTHCHYVAEKQKRESAESVLEQVKQMAKIQDFDGLFNFLMNWGVWN